MLGQRSVNRSSRPTWKQPAAVIFDLMIMSPRPQSCCIAEYTCPRLTIESSEFASCKRKFPGQMGTESKHLRGVHLTSMRNLLVGLFLGAALTAGFGVSASGPKGPLVSGQSGPLKYAVIIGGEVECVTPWLSVEAKTIECYTPPAPPEERPDPMRNVAE